MCVHVCVLSVSVPVSVPVPMCLCVCVCVEVRCVRCVHMLDAVQVKRGLMLRREKLARIVATVQQMSAHDAL